MRLKLVLMGKNPLDFVDHFAMLKICFFLFLNKGLTFQLGHAKRFELF